MREPAARAFQELSALYEARLRPVPRDIGGRATLAVVGADIPVELATACGYVPVRLVGDPRPSAQGDDPGQEYCGPGIDPVAVSILGRVLAGAAAESAGLVACADNEGTLRFFFYLRELQRLEPRVGVPPLTFFDLLHLPQRTAAVYSRRRFDALSRDLEAWSGRQVTDADLRSAARQHDLVRDMIAQICARLRNGPHGPLLTGAQALAVIGASQVASLDTWIPLAERLLAASEGMEPQPGVRVFLTGCSHDHPAAYGLIESLGAVVVGEDHDWGSLAGGPRIGEPADIRDALVHRRVHRASASAGHSAAARAAQTISMARACRADLVIAWSRIFDEGPAWDVPAQRVAADATALPFLAVPAQPYAAVPEPTRTLVEAAIQRIAEDRKAAR